MTYCKAPNADVSSAIRLATLLQSLLDKPRDESLHEWLGDTLECAPDHGLRSNLKAPAFP